MNGTAIALGIAAVEAEFYVQDTRFASAFLLVRAGGFLAALIAGIGHAGDICRAGLLTYLFFTNHRAS